MFKYIDHVAVHCSDLDRSARFYTDVMGFEPWVGHDNRIQYFKCGDTLLELTMKTPKQVMSGLHFCLQAEDIEKAVAHLKEKGVECAVELRPSTGRVPGEEGLRRAVFKGPDGELIEIRG
ncbi:MAG: VOC family protein [Alphaproteobacteria bacterium]|nr:VOC family protein [Alphaproteobacteria bacterium]